MRSSIAIGRGQITNVALASPCLGGIE